MEPERRKSRRIERSFTVRIRPFQPVIEGVKSASVKWDIVTLKDISPEGILFNYTKPIPPGTELELYLNLPAVPEPVFCIGRVCRIDDMPRSKFKPAKIQIYRIAVIFSKIASADQEVIKNYLNRL